MKIRGIIIFLFATILGVACANSDENGAVKNKILNRLHEKHGASTASEAMNGKAPQKVGIITTNGIISTNGLNGQIGLTAQNGFTGQNGLIVENGMQG